uniref:Uncharacterized protein n=1 Tax=Romanomermis culicivorax TaxID=13658 RepID=A0A915I8I2_ROMCU
MNDQKIFSPKTPIWRKRTVIQTGQEPASASNIGQHWPVSGQSDDDWRQGRFDDLRRPFNDGPTMTTGLIAGTTSYGGRDAYKRRPVLPWLITRRLSNLDGVGMKPSSAAPSFSCTKRPIHQSLLYFCKRRRYMSVQFPKILSV